MYCPSDYGTGTWNIETHAWFDWKKLEIPVESQIVQVTTCTQTYVLGKRDFSLQTYVFW